jgi:hypothetical protein
MNRYLITDLATALRPFIVAGFVFFPCALDAQGIGPNVLQNVTGDLPLIGFQPEVREHVSGSETYVLCNIEGRLYSIPLAGGARVELTAGLENPAVQKYDNSSAFSHKSTGGIGGRWIASGSHVYFLSNNTLYRAPVAGGPLVTLVTGTYNFRMSDNGDAIVYPRNSSLYVMPSAGGPETLVVPSSGYSVISNYAFTPNGQRILFTGHPASTWHHDTGLFSVPSSGGSITRLNTPVALPAGEWRRILRYWINPSSTRVVFHSNEVLTDGHCIHSAPLNAANQAVAIEKRASNRMAQVTPQLVFTPDGSRIAYALPIDGVTSGYGLFSAPVAGGTVIRHDAVDQISSIPPSSQDGSNNFSFSNDGLKLMSLGFLNSTYSQILYGFIHTNTNLYEWPFNSASPRRQVSQPPTSATATFGFADQRYLDGTNGIVYSMRDRNSGYRYGIYHCSPENLITRLDQTPLEGILWGGSVYHLSRDQSRVLFCRAGQRANQYDVYSSTVDGAQVRRLTPDAAYNRFVNYYGPLSDGNSAWLVGNFETSGRSDIFISRPSVFVPVFPEIAVEDSGSDIPSGASKPFGNVPPGTVKDLTFSLLNTGDGELTLTGNPIVALSGSDDFSVTSQPSSPVAPGGNTNFTVRFAPTTPGSKTASLAIASDDADEASFIIHLAGTSFSLTTDTDGDGMSDASEFNMAALGFDWTVAQPDLVNTYFQNAAGAGLYDATQLQAMHSGVPLIAKDPATGKVKLTMDWKISNDLSGFADFPAPAGSSVSITPEGDVEFEFPAPADKGFFRVGME